MQRLEVSGAVRPLQSSLGLKRLSFSAEDFVTQFYFMARQIPVGQGLLIIRASPSHSKTPHSVGGPFTSVHSKVKTST